MPKKPQGAPKIELAPEELWFAGMKARLARIEELKAENAAFNEKMKTLSERRQRHNVEFNRALTVIRAGGMTDVQLRNELRTLRYHERWNRHYGERYGRIDEAAKINAETVALLTKQLHTTPHPGEEPLLESADDAIE